MGRKRIQRDAREQACFELVKELTVKLDEMRQEVIGRAELITGRTGMSVNSLHGIIGGKNNEYANVADECFQDSHAFIHRWVVGMIERYKASKRHPCAVWDVISLYRDKLCQKYIKLFLERNFYKHYKERVCIKPDKQLWQVWFGSQLNYGLFIAPVQLPDGTWRIDHSEIRRAKYQYWTIQHILTVGGFINPVYNTMVKIRSIEDLALFYINDVATLSISQYERKICEMYAKYLQTDSMAIYDPFLIPEFHYEGPQKKCKYRLDFTVLNPYTFKFMGFEISPSSTHMHIEKSKNKTQTQLNDELKKKWGKECQKRNEYLSDFNISCYTFSDEQLDNLDNCFSIIMSNIKERPNNILSLEDAEKYIMSLKI